jgi:ABC-type transport system substrate-binding protein
VKSKILFISLAVVLALSLGLVGCTGGGGGGWPANAPQGTVVIGRASLAGEDFLPWAGGAIEKNYLSGTIYESLTMRTRDSTPTPCIATSWNMSPDGKNWQFNIRQGIHFHDNAGTDYGTLTAADVKYTFERLASNGNNTAPLYSVSKSHIAGGLQGDFGSNVTAAIEVVDNATIIFHLVKVDIAFDKTFTGPDMMGVVCKSFVQAHGDSVAAANPVGTGPYVKDSQVVGSYIQLRVIDFAGSNNWSTHWRFGPLTAADPTKYFRYIKFAIVQNDNTRAQGLINNDYQMVEVPPTVVPQIVADNNCAIYPDITFVSATDIIRLGGLDQLDSFGHSPADPVKRYSTSRPWADNTSMGGNDTAGTYVRRALNLAINKTAMLNTIYEGVGAVAAASMSIPEWVSTLTPYPYDPAAAISNLTAAGYGSGFTVTLIADERYSEHLVAVAVKSYWDAIGVNTTILDELWSVLGADWQKGGNTTGNLAVDPTNPTNPNYNYAWVHRTPPSSGDPALAINMAFDPSASKGDYSEATVNALRLSMLGELNPALRTQKCKDLGAYVNAQATQVFLVSVYGPIGVRTTLAEPRDVFDLKENPELIHRA